jgi:glycosyltransferase involved in cell wall biosynthesis
MRVILAHKFFHLTGGSEVFYFETGKILQEMGHEVAFFSTTSDKNIPTSYNNYFVNVIDFNRASIREKIGFFPSIFHNSEAAKNFEKLIIDFKPDLINVFAFYGHLSPSILKVAKKYRIPVVNTCNDYKHLCTNYKFFHHGKNCFDCQKYGPIMATVNKCCHDSFLTSLTSTLEAYYYNTIGVYSSLINHYNFASEYMMNATKLYWKDRDVSCSLVKNPFYISDYKKLQEFPEEKGYLLYFGRLVEEKGLEKLLSAMKLVKSDITLKIVGVGASEMGLKNIVESFGLKNVEFLGEIWGENLQKIISESIATIIPSIWQENYPYAVLQSFAMERAVLGSDRGGIPEMVINHKHGLIFNPDSIQDIAEKINFAVSNPSLLKKWGKDSRSWVSHELSKENFYNSLMESYRQVIK